MVQAPEEQRFSAHPVSWYLFGRAGEIRSKPLTRQLLGGQLVAFRTESGRPAILEARCSHLGADLGRGCVVGEAVQCPFHHWEYGPDGRCTRIPSQPDIPAFARQRSYPLAERHGLVYLFNGQQPLFPLPFFAGCRPEDFASGTSFQFLARCSWYMLAANLFDTQHWLTQHKRRVLGTPVVDCPHPLARRIRFDAEVVGPSLADRLLRRFAGGKVQVSITCWGGNFFFATGFFRHVRSYIQVVTTPLDENRLDVSAMVFVRKSGNRLLRALIEPVSLWLRRLFTQAFMRDEFHELAGIRYSPHTLIASDRELIDFFHWAASLPQKGDE